MTHFKNYILTLFLFTFHIDVFAENIQTPFVNDWGTYESNGAITAYLNKNDLNMLKYLKIFISFAENGKKRLYLNKLYFNIENDKSVSACEPYDFLLNTRKILIINGQAVKFYTWCQKYSDAPNITYLEYTPETSQGHTFLYNALLKAKDTITIQIEEDSIPISAKGFAKAWRNAGSNAL